MHTLLILAKKQFWKIVEWLWKPVDAFLNYLEWLNITSSTGYCWHCEWPHKGRICPVHKVKMQPMRGHKFK